MNASKKRADEWTTRTTAANAGEDLKKIAAEKRTAVSFWEGDTVKILALSKDGHVDDVLAVVSCGDAQLGNKNGLAGLARAAAYSEVDAMLEILDTIQSELTESELNADELLHKTEQVLSRIARKRLALINDAQKNGGK
jgi:hypothetical protein